MLRYTKIPCLYKGIGCFLNNRFDLQMCSANAGWSVGLRKNICHVLFYFHTRKEYKVIFKHLILWFSLEGIWGLEGGNGYSHEQSGTDCDFTKKRVSKCFAHQHEGKQRCENVCHVSL